MGNVSSALKSVRHRVSAVTTIVFNISTFVLTTVYWGTGEYSPFTNEETGSERVGYLFTQPSQPRLVFSSGSFPLRDVASGIKWNKYLLKLQNPEMAQNFHICWNTYSIFVWVTGQRGVSVITTIFSCEIHNFCPKGNSSRFYDLQKDDLSHLM